MINGAVSNHRATFNQITRTNSFRQGFASEVGSVQITNLSFHNSINRQAHTWRDAHPVARLQIFCVYYFVFVISQPYRRRRLQR